MADDVLCDSCVVHEDVIDVLATGPRSVFNSGDQTRRRLVSHCVVLCIPPTDVDDKPCLVGVCEAEGIAPTSVPGLDGARRDRLPAHGDAASREVSDGVQLR
ncbi:hypothetical protein RRF57_008567 [Xylaria bambusicola]|uniref:Uncharacterized protein n=1 Tax=Xylaria bambusicola TaxID=326684 RepID=A0AAN7V1V4_9PEZI